jgi:4-alpha-glucanotransferase
VPGPGRPLFDAIAAALGTLPIVAEDLGLITSDVVALRDAFGFPGMKILQFGFGGDATDGLLPHNHGRRFVAYTGTHDNDTTRGWWASLPEADRASTELDPDDPAWSLIGAAWSSRAALAIAPLQDVLDLGTEARMNLPGTEEGNWKWRFSPGDLTKENARRLRDLTESSLRAGSH